MTKIDDTVAVQSAPARTRKGPKHAPRKTKPSRSQKGFWRRWWWVFVAVPVGDLFLVAGDRTVQARARAQVDLPAP